MDMPTSPTNIYLIDLDKNEEYGNCTNVTNSLYGNLSNDALITPQLVRYKSFDGLEIPAFVYVLYKNTFFYKSNGKDKSKCGAILSIHGGPQLKKGHIMITQGYSNILHLMD